jgi:WD repeat-containing protein 19
LKLYISDGEGMVPAMI